MNCNPETRSRQIALLDHLVPVWKFLGVMLNLPIEHAIEDL